MSEEKLRRCPFCGGEAQYDEDCFGRGLVQCKKCGAVIIDKYTYQDCIELWNNREVANRTWTQKVYDSFGEVRDKE